MDDPGIDAVNRWGERHPIFAATLRVAAVWAVLQGIAFFFAPVGWFANGLAVVWLLALAYLNRDRLPEVWDWLTWRFPALEALTKPRPGSAADDARIEGDTAVRAALMDTIEGDIQVAGQRDAFTTQIARLEAIDNRDHQQELLLRQLRRNVVEIDRIEAQRHATPASMGTVRMAAFGAVGAPQGFLGSLPGLSWLKLAPWGLAGVLALTTGFAHLRAEKLDGDADKLRDALQSEQTKVQELGIAVGEQRAALESLRHESIVTRELNETLQSRQTRLERRLRESSNAQLEAARGGRPIDLDGRLRDFTVQPFAGSGAGGFTTPDPAGGVPGESPGAGDVHAPGASGASNDGAGAGDSAEPR